MSDSHSDPAKGAGRGKPEPPKKLPAKAVSKTPARTPAKKAKAPAQKKTASKRPPAKAAPEKAPPRALESAPPQAVLTAGAAAPPLPAPVVPVDHGTPIRRRLAVGLTLAVTLALLLRRLRLR
jgi:hypothetical protein